MINEEYICSLKEALTKIHFPKNNNAITIPETNNANNDKEQKVISLIYKSFIIFQHYIMSSIVL